jgi:integrase
MPRTASIRYYPSRGAYYTKLQGQQYRLASGPKDEPHGPTYQAAVRRYTELILRPTAPPAASNDVPVGLLVVRYFHALERDQRRSTLHKYRTLLDPALRAFGQRTTAELKPYVVHDWLAGMVHWSNNTKHSAIESLNTVLYWAVHEGLLTSNPLAGMSRPEKRPRGADVVLPEPLQDLLIAAARPAFARFLTFLRWTGCRPGEAIHAEAQHYHDDMLIFPWNPPAGAWRWKNAKTTQRDRVIYLTPAARDLLDLRGGPVLRTERGQAWSNNNLTMRFFVLKRQRPIVAWCAQHGFQAERIMPYGFRHAFITRLLAKGCPIKVVADLCGTSVLMIEKTYAHVHDDRAAMKRLFAQFAP